MFQYFMKEPSNATLVSGFCATKSDGQLKEAKLNTYYQVVNYLLYTYVADDVIVEAKAESTNFKKPEQMYGVRYLEFLLKKGLTCGRVYKEAH